MKKILTIAIILLMSTKCFAGTIYVATTGNNTTGDGTVGNPYLTVSHAISTAVSGDIISVANGTYNLTSTITVPVGISIHGSGVGTIFTGTSIANTNGPWNYIFYLASPDSTDGNQRLTNFTLDGNSRTIEIGIGCYGRNNVEIDNINALNFDFAILCITSSADVLRQGVFGDAEVVFPGEVYVKNNPYVTGNHLHDIVGNNCSGFQAWNGGATYGSGQLWIGGQQNMIIENCTLTQTQRPTRQNGWLIKQFLWSKNLTIRNNTLINNHYPYVTNGDWDGTADYWNFSIEIFNVQGLQIYNNNCNGSVDVNRLVKGVYAYSARISNNIVGFNDLGTGQENGVILEFDVSDALVDSNTFRNITEPISFSPRPGSLIQNFSATNNLAYNIGQTGQNNKGSAVFFHDNGTGFNIQNFFLNHNTFVANSTLKPEVGFSSSNVRTGTATNVVIKNSIFQDFGNSLGHTAIGSSDGSRLTNVTINNNLFYQNQNNIYWGTFAGASANPNAPYVSTPNYTGNPLLNASYIPQAGSPALLAADDGTDIGYTGGAPDVTPPTVISTNPTNSATGVPIGAYNIIINFNEFMNTSTLNSTNITGVAGTITAGSTYASIAATLAASTTYTITVDNVEDASGNVIAAPYVFSFTTAASGGGGSSGSGKRTIILRGVKKIQ